MIHLYTKQELQNNSKYTGVIWFMDDVRTINGKSYTGEKVSQFIEFYHNVGKMLVVLCIMNVFLLHDLCCLQHKPVSHSLRDTHAH